MPKDYKKMFLEEQNKNLKLEKELSEAKKEIETLRSNQSVMNNFSPNSTQTPQLSKSFENDVKYIVELSQRMSIILKECRRHMLPVDVGRKIDNVLREIDRM